MMKRISQEFYCSECNGYFMVRLNMALNHEVEVVCPKCKHEHRRVIYNGVLHDEGRFATDAKERVMTTIATYHAEPVTSKMRAGMNRRSGVAIDEQLAMRWAEMAYRERDGVMFDDD